MELLPFLLPLGDELVERWDGSLRFTDAMTALFSGGPTQTVKGRIILTTRELAFRSPVEMPQALTVALANVSGATHDRVLGVFAGRRVKVVATVGGQQFALRFEVGDPARFVDLLERTRIGATPREPPATLLDAALCDGITDRGRYASTLATLSFSQSHWYTEDIEPLRTIVRDTTTALGLTLPDGFARELDLAVETEFGPEDYQTGPGSEAWGRREQIARIAAAINAALPATEPRRFYTFADDLPSWPDDELVCVLLTAAQRDDLLRLAVLRSA